MFYRILVLLCLIPLGGFAQNSAALTMEGAMLLSNVNVVDVEQNLILPDMDILVQNGKIQRITPSGNLALPGLQVIDCSGRYAVPGLFECHAHMMAMSLPDEPEQAEVLKEFLNLGITQVRDVGGPLDMLKALTERIAADPGSGPRIFYSGPMLERSPMMWADRNEQYPGFTVGIDTQADVDSMLIRLKQDGASLIKTFNRFDPEIYAYLVQKAREIDLPITHDPGTPLFNRIPVDKAMDLGITCFEHGKALWPCILRDDLQAEHDSILAINPPDQEKAQKLAMKIFMSGTNSISPEKLDLLAQRMASEGSFYCPTIKVFQLMGEQEGENQFLVKTLEEMSKYITRALIKHGVRMLAGVDNCFPLLHDELENLKELGLDEMEILRSASLYPALWLRVQDQYGSLSEGKMASIVIVDENPLSDISNLRQVRLVLKDGLKVFEKE